MINVWDKNAGKCASIMLEWACLKSLVGDNFKVANCRPHKRQCEISGLSMSAKIIREVSDIH